MTNPAVQSHDKLQLDGLLMGLEIPGSVRDGRGGEGAHSPVSIPSAWEGLDSEELDKGDARFFILDGLCIVVPIFDVGVGDGVVVLIVLVVEVVPGWKLEVSEGEKQLDERTVGRLGRSRSRTRSRHQSTWWRVLLSEAEERRKRERGFQMAMRAVKRSMSGVRMRRRILR